MRVLITGGTGSLGQALVPRWRDKYKLRILSRNPHKQQMAQAKFGLDSSAFVLADICDYEAVKAACVGQDILIHAAALKVVSQGEKFPAEYLRANALGSQVVARAWRDTHEYDISYPLYINSDKAVAPVNHYGCTKRIGEMAFISRGFSSIRYGNVVQSEGSFIHLWRDRLSKGLPIYLRHPVPTRYFLSFDDALDLIDNAIDLMIEGHQGVFIPRSMPAFSLADVAKALTPEANICYHSLQPGEKQHEILLQEGEKARRLSDLLAIVESGREKVFPSECSSETTHRLSGEDVLTRLGVSPIQEVFA